MIEDILSVLIPVLFIFPLIGLYMMNRDIRNNISKQYNSKKGIKSNTVKDYANSLLPLPDPEDDPEFFGLPKIKSLFKKLRKNQTIQFVLIILFIIAMVIEIKYL